jgi:hypothetical protein
MLNWLTQYYTFIPAAFQEVLIDLAAKMGFQGIQNVVEWLLDHGVGVNYENHKGETFLSAVLSRSFSYAPDLLQLADKHGAGTQSAIEKHAIHALMQAVYSITITPNHIWLINWILCRLPILQLNKIQPESTTGHFQVTQPITMFELLCSIGSDTLVSGLLDLGAAPRIVSSSDNSSLHIACGLAMQWENFFPRPSVINTAIIKRLIAHGAKVNIGQTPPLFTLLSHNGTLEQIKLLLAAGAKTQCNGMTALATSIAKGSIEAIEYFLKISTDLNAMASLKPNAEKTHPLLFACASRNSVEIIELLMKHGANPFELASEEPNSLSVFEWVKLNTPHLELTFTKAILQRQTSKPSVVISTAPRDASFAHEKTGDIDYARTIAQQLYQQQGVPAKLLEGYQSEEEIFQAVATASPNNPSILHLMVNCPNIGTMTTPQKLKQFKENGGKLVITVIEFAKHAGRYSGNQLQEMTAEYIAIADHVIFLDENDFNCAKKHCKNHDIALPKTSVINVPATIAIPSNSSAMREGGHILSFGMIRNGKGVAHLIKLAQLIKNSDHHLVKNKKIMVVGSICLAQKDHSDSALYKLMTALYPSKHSELEKKTPLELKALFKQYNDIDRLLPELPIGLHLDVAQENLPALFDKCTYSYLPAYRGATLRNSSISSSLSNQFITFAHEGRITPASLKADGAYSDALVLIAHRDRTNVYSYAADTVFEEIQRREENPDLNAETITALETLVGEQLSHPVIAAKHALVYSGLTRPSLALGGENRFYTSAAASSVNAPIPKGQDKTPPHKKYKNVDNYPLIKYNNV